MIMVHGNQDFGATLAAGEAQMTTRELKQPRRREGHHPCQLLNGIFSLLSCVPSCLLTIPPSTATSDEILERALNNSTRSRAVPYSGLREYRLRNFRFDKEATVSVQATYRPGVGTTHRVLDHSGSAKLVEIVEKLLASEADVSKSEKLAEYEFSPANYQACLRGVETVSGRTSYVIDLVPKHRSKYLIRGTAWVDRSSYAILRLDGVTAASVSMWVGAPHIQLEFSEIDGVWLPTHTGAVSSGLLLGTSELEILYTDYLVKDFDHPVAIRGIDSVQQTRP
jgi:hypothetical protein